MAIGEHLVRSIRSLYRKRKEAFAVVGQHSLFGVEGVIDRSLKVRPQCVLSCATYVHMWGTCAYQLSIVFH